MVVECTLRVSPRDYYSTDLTRRIPVRVTIVTINGDTGFGIMEPLEGGEESMKAYVEGMRNSESIVEAEVTYRSPEAYWTRVVHKLERDSIYETILKSGCMTRLPIIIQGGVQYHVVLAPSNELLSKLLRELRNRFTTAKVVRIRSKPTSPQSILTSKQQEAFLLAYRQGYYEMPRKVYLRDLGHLLGIKRVAMQERLRRAEIRILSDFAEELL